jgi:hypothetical protein
MCPGRSWVFILEKVESPYNAFNKEETRKLPLPYITTNIGLSSNYQGKMQQILLLTVSLAPPYVGVEGGLEHIQQCLVNICKGFHREFGAMWWKGKR